MMVNITLRRQLWQLDYFSRLGPGRADRRAGRLDAGPDPAVPGLLGHRIRRRPGQAVAGEIRAGRERGESAPDQGAGAQAGFRRVAGAHHLLRVSVPPQWAVKLMNRATADNQSAQAEEEGLEPTKEWVKDLVDEVIADEFGSPDLELAWLDEDTGAAQAEARLEARVKIGAATLNELRDALGLEPFQNPTADRPMVLTATGYVPIEAGAGGAGTTPGGKGQSPSSVSDRAVVAKASV